MSRTTAAMTIIRFRYIGKSLKHLKEPMTHTVNRLLYHALRGESLPEQASVALPSLAHPYFRELAKAYCVATNEGREGSRIAPDS